MALANRVQFLKRTRNINTLIGLSLILVSLYSVAAIVPYPSLHLLLFLSGSLCTWGIGLCILDLLYAVRQQKPISQFMVVKRQSGQFELWVRAGRQCYQRLLSDSDEDRIRRRMRSFVEAEHSANPINHVSNDKCTKIEVYNEEGHFVSNVECTNKIEPMRERESKEKHREDTSIQIEDERRKVGAARA